MDNQQHKHNTTNTNTHKIAPYTPKLTQRPTRKVFKPNSLSKSDYYELFIWNGTASCHIAESSENLEGNQSSIRNIMNGLPVHFKGKIVIAKQSWPD